MAGPLNATVVLSRCSKTKQCFGVRIEERGGDWIRTWAFPIDEKKAQREGFDKNAITGSLNVDKDFPGCPYCKSDIFIQCECGKSGCGGEIKQGLFFAKYTCPWCGKTLPIQFTDSVNVQGGGY